MSAQTECAQADHEAFFNVKDLAVEILAENEELCENTKGVALVTYVANFLRSYYRKASQNSLGLCLCGVKLPAAIAVRRRGKPNDYVSIFEASGKSLQAAIEEREENIKRCREQLYALKSLRRFSQFYFHDHETRTVKEVLLGGQEIGQVVIWKTKDPNTVDASFMCPALADFLEKQGEQA